jgi:hypothetical protein
VSEWSGLGPEIRSPVLDPDARYLEEDDDEVAFYLLTLDSINFGRVVSDTAQERRRSGYYTIASSLADRFRKRGPWPAEKLRLVGPGSVARVPGGPGEERTQAKIGKRAP